MQTNGDQVLLIVSVVLFALGFLCLILSIVILVKQSLGRGIQSITDRPQNQRKRDFRRGIWAGWKRLSAH